MAIAAAVPADCPSTKNTGSMRMEPYAMWVDDKQTDTSKFTQSEALGVSAR